MPNLTTAEPATIASISETEAAKRLGVIPATLRTWRLKGLLADGLVTETPSPAPGGRARIRYDANWINLSEQYGKSIFDAETEAAGAQT